MTEKVENKKPMRGQLSARNPKPYKTGRPPTTLEDLPKDWQKIMLDSAKEGGGATSYMSKLEIGKSALETLLTNHEQFRDTYMTCQILAQEWYESKGREMITGKQGNATVWSLNMTNRYNWRSSRQEHVGDKDAPLAHTTKKTDLTEQELIEELEARGLPTSIFKDV